MKYAACISVSQGGNARLLGALKKPILGHEYVHSQKQASSYYNLQHVSHEKKKKLYRIPPLLH